MADEDTSCPKNIDELEKQIKEINDKHVYFMMTKRPAVRLKVDICIIL